MDRSLYNKIVVSLLFKLDDKKNATHKLSSIVSNSKIVSVIYCNHSIKEREALLQIVKTYDNYLSCYRRLINDTFYTVLTFNKLNNFDRTLELINNNMCEIIPTSLKKHMCAFVNYSSEVVSHLLLYTQPQKNKIMIEDINVNEVEMNDVAELNFINDKETEGQYDSELTDLSCFEF